MKKLAIRDTECIRTVGDLFVVTVPMIQGWGDTGQQAHVAEMLKRLESQRFTSMHPVFFGQFVSVGQEERGESYEPYLEVIGRVKFLRGPAVPERLKEAVTVVLKFLADNLSGNIDVSGIARIESAGMRTDFEIDEVKEAVSA